MSARPFTSTGKQVFYFGVHFADGASDHVARKIVRGMNERHARTTLSPGSLTADRVGGCEARPAYRVNAAGEVRQHETVKDGNGATHVGGNA